MQIGDPKKTAVLAIVAIGAIGFCFKQLTGGGDTPKALRTDATAAPDASGALPAANATLAMVSLDQLRNDAFSHPKLASKGVANQTGPITPQANNANPNPVPNLGSEGGPNSLPGPLNGPLQKEGDPVWPKPVNPGAPDGKPDGTVKVEKVTQVTLKAIVKVGQRIAYISVDGQEARGFRSGDLLKDDIQVTVVNDDSVIVKSGTKTVTLKVGQQGDL